MKKRLKNLWDVFLKFTPPWLPQNLLRYAISVLALFLAATISFPQFISNTLIWLIDHTACSLKLGLEKQSDNNAYLIVIVLTISVFILFILAGFFALGAKTAWQKMTLVIDRDNQLYDKTNDIIDNLTKVEENLYNQKTLEAFRETLENLLLLDEMTTEDDEAHLFDQYGRYIVGTTNSNEHLSDFGHQYLPELVFIGEDPVEVIRISRKTRPLLFSTVFRRYKIIDVVSFWVNEKCFFLVVVSPRESAMLDVNYAKSVEAVRRIIIMENFYFTIQQRYNTINTTGTS